MGRLQHEWRQLATAVPGGNGASSTPGDIRQFRGEARQFANDAAQLRRMVQGQGVDPKVLDEVLRNLKALDDDRVYQDAATLERLQSAVAEGMKRFEFSLRRQAESKGSEVFLSGADDVPEQYRKLVEQYYKSLSKGSAKPDRGAPERGRRKEAVTGCEVARELMKRAVVVSSPRRAGGWQPPAAQGFRQGWGRLRTRPAALPRRADSFDGSFTFCRGMYTSDRREAGGMGWWTDYPGRRHQLLHPPVRADQDPRQQAARRQPNHLVVRLTDDALFNCPMIQMEDVGTMRLSDAEVVRLREYLLKGGFLYVDDFWGEWAWEQWAEEIGRVLPPSEYPIRDITPAPPAVPADVRDRQAAADPVDQFVDAAGRRHLGAGRGDRACRTSAASATRTAG